MYLLSFKMNYRRFELISSDEDEDENYVDLRKVKVCRKRGAYLTTYSEKEFYDGFRLRKNTVVSLLEQIEDVLAPRTYRGRAIKPMQQLLLTLRFFATGNFLITAGDFMGISKTSACRIVEKVSYAIAGLKKRYINMTSTREEMENAAQKFYRIARFPRVIGAIDCTLIRMDSVGGADAEIFRCRKNFFALNVQTVSDANLKIKNIVARWPGSTHDQTIFNNSNLKNEFERDTYKPYILIGDSGYHLEPYLMTKLRNVMNEAENLYNESVIRTRNVVERQYGVWKKRFPVLSFGMRLKLNTIMAVIIATAVLHNMAIDWSDEPLPEWLVQEDIEVEEEQEGGDQDDEHLLNGGRNMQRLMINILQICEQNINIEKLCVV